MNGNIFKKHLLATSVFAGALVSAFAMPAVAQEEGDGEARQETVQVTGTRIEQSNFVSATPVNVFNSEQIELTGAVNTAEILRTLPAAGVSGLTSTNSNFFTQSSGINSIELRNLGEDRTLVLVNGRRFVGGVPGTQTVDLNSIPTEFIERIDVVTGGASAIYGSDAIAGVVNIILKDDFEGVVGSFQGGMSDYDDDESFKASVTMGSPFADGKGQALASVSWSKENGVFARDREERGLERDGLSNAYFQYLPDQPFDWQTTQFPYYSSFSERGRITVPGNGNWVFDETTSTSRPFQSANADGSELDGFNRQGYRAIAVPTERFMFSSVVDYEINPFANLFFEGTFATTDTKSRLEPFPLSSEDIYGDNLAQFIDDDGDGVADRADFGIPILNPFVPEGIRDAARAGADFDGDGVQDIADADLVVGFARRTTELINRGADNTRQTARFVTGLEGDIFGTETWSYETSINFGRTTQAQRSTGQVNVLNMRNALNVTTDGSGNIVCADPIARAQGCVPVNIFGKGSISPAASDYLRAPSSVQAEISQFVWNGYVTGELGFTSPMATTPVQTVLGAEYRSERSKSVPDALSQVGLNAGNISPVVEGDFQVMEFFGELQIPLIEGQKYAEELSLNLAARQSDYTTVGNTFAWSGNLQYAPTEWLRLRAQYSEAVRAPNIGELFQPQSETFEGGTDPCAGLGTAGFAGSADTVAACSADPLVAARVARDGAFIPSQAEVQGIGGFNGGNPNLTEESAESITFGAIFTPQFGNDWIDNFAVTVDYYDIEITDAISAIGRNTSLQECYVNSGGVYDPTSDFCSNVVRYASGPFVGAIDELNATNQNLSVVETAGIDVQASYFLPINDLPFLAGNEFDFGELNMSLTYGYLDKFDTTAFDGAPVQDNVGTYGLFDHEYLLGFVYRRGPLTVAYDLNYLPEAMLFTGDPDYLIPAATFQDIQVRYNLESEYFGGALELVAGVDNIADEFVAFGQGLDSTGTGTDGAVYDAIGRRWYAGFRTTF